MDAYEIVLMCPPWRNVGPTAAVRAVGLSKALKPSLLPLSPYCIVVESFLQHVKFTKVIPLQYARGRTQTHS